MAQLKIVLFANTEWYLFNFRRSLAHKLRDVGFDVVLVSPHGPYGSRLRAEGFRWLPIPMNRRSVNPIRELAFLWHLLQLYRRERPDIVHHFTIKCVVYGSLAARLAGIGNRVNAVAGLGYVFTGTDLLAQALRPFVRMLMKLALSGERTRLILQNPDDQVAFQTEKLVSQDRIRLIRGSGVDSERFRPEASAPSNRRHFRAILAARLLWEKGVAEYVEAARMIRALGFNIEFLLAGVPDPGNPGAVDEATVSEWQAAGLVTALGHVENMETWLQRVDVAVLPSYYGEGVPRSLIEAAACALPIVTTDAPGCREIVEQGKNGILVPVRDARAIAEAIRFLYDHPSERTRMGTAGREKVLREFDEKLVLAKTLAVYTELVPEMSLEHRSLLQP